MIVLEIVAIILLIYLCSNVVYLLFFSLAGKFNKKKTFQEREPEVSFCVMIPAYKANKVIVNTVAENLQQHYPKELYEIFVIADGFDVVTLQELKKYDVNVIEVSFANSTKAKAINKAFEQIEAVYDYVVLLDEDNIMEQKFLQKLNNRLVSNVQIIQAHRVALNADTSFALLDAVSEEINNYIFRKGHVSVGLSSALIGSGIAAGFNFFKDIMSSVDAVSGFDKELELKILHRRIKIHYLEDAFVFDEKVRTGAVFQNQRRRWLAAQFYYLRRFFFSGCVHLFHGNFDYVDKLFQFLLFPRVLLLGTLTALTVLLYSIGWQYYGSYALILVVLNCAALIIAIPQKYVNAKTAKALLMLPKAFLLFFSNLFKLKGANKKFIHTPHGKKEGN